jgi:hypothetical protein
LRRKRISHLCRAQLQESKISTKFKSLLILEMHFNQCPLLLKTKKKKAQLTDTKYNMSLRVLSIRPLVDLLHSMLSNQRAIGNLAKTLDMMKNRIVGRIKPLHVHRKNQILQRKLLSFLSHISLITQPLLKMVRPKGAKALTLSTAVCRQLMSKPTWSI